MLSNSPCRSVLTVADTAYARVPARAALAGNPSDGYGGAVLAVALHEIQAEVDVVPAANPSVEPPSTLVTATVRRFARELGGDGARTRLRWRTSIPRGVGLGGSSAIVIAATRALCDLLDLTLAPLELARFALAVENDELGIAAGLQDRIAQAYSGLTFMDFARDRYEPLDPSLLPPLLVAWRPDSASDSGPVHSDLRARYERNETRVLRAVSALATAAFDARQALLDGDREAFARSLDATFEARRGILALNPEHVEMIELARAHGAAANYTGSGGAIVAFCPDVRDRGRLHEALGRLGCGVLAV